MVNTRLDDNSDSIRLHMIVTRAWLNKVIAYAKHHDMTQSEAIRFLVARALK